MSRLRLLVTAVLMLLLFGTTVSAASIALAWDPNVEPEVSGYTVQVGSVAGGTDQTFDVGSQTSWTFTSATAGKTYYFRVQAYTAAGVKSLPSNEVSGRAPLATTVPPFGSFDTPTNNSAGITGSIAVTGWALDDNGVSKVRILRAPVTGETPGVLVPIGDATLVPGARPDIAAQYSTYPGRDYAGWGYLMLTNFLPNLGNGTFTIYAYADDGDGHSTPLGTKAITVSNASATMPFGAIDTPSQGQTVAGVINNFGWVLAPGTRRADPTGGGTVQVVIDGVKVGSPSGWTSRSDLSGYFPLAQYTGINTALGVFTFDTRTLTNGVHTIAWAVTDNAGGTAGVGSRYFTVANGAAATAASTSASTDVAASTFASAASTATPVAVTTPLVGRRGFDLTAPTRTWRANRSGVVVVQAEELDRIELNANATSGGMVSATGLAPFPAGSGLDADGVFIWQPGVAYVGTYDLVFTGPDGVRQVRIVLNPKGSGRVGPQIAVDAPARGTDGTATLAAGQAFTVAGWAADLDDQWGTGVEAVHVWARPRDGGDPVFLGQAALGGSRSDVAAIYGDRFGPSGYGLTAAGLPAGDYDLNVFAWSTILQDFAPATTVPVSVR